jgi:sugar O-acyltransferase (sialic acid O-acetyltransferase NeuD family)
MPGKELFVVGAGGFGREVFHWSSQHPDCGVKWFYGGFLDENPNALDGYDLPSGIVGSPSSWKVGKDHVFLLGVGLPKVKAKILSSLLAQNADFLTLVHPTALIGPRVTLGRGCVVCPMVVLTCDIKIGDFVVLNVASSIGHDARIGSFTTLSGHADVTGFAKIGEGVLLGSHASVIPGAVVGHHAVVGAGTVVTGRVPDQNTVFGVPGKRIF